MWSERKKQGLWSEQVAARTSLYRDGEAVEGLGRDGGSMLILNFTPRGEGGCGRVGLCAGRQFAVVAEMPLSACGQRGQCITAEGLDL